MGTAGAAPISAAPVGHRSPPVSGPSEVALTALLAVLALLSVSPLLAWVSGLGSFARWFDVVALPAIVGVGVLAVVARRTPRFERLRLVVALGTLGGLIGTIAYDLVRIPFVLGGRQVLAPIESYGVLLLDASGSSSLSGFSGWGYHFVNGICFGIAYAAVALGRSRWWAVAWALVLETATIVTPFADFYSLRGQYDVIAIAYAAHVPYGLALGYLTERPVLMRAKLDEVGRWVVPATLVALVALLVVWHRPAPPGEAPAGITATGSTFDPRWTRVSEGGCVPVTNTGERALALSGPIGDPTVAAHATASVCFTGAGVHRLKVNGEAWSGGFVIVDPALARGTAAVAPS